MEEKNFYVELKNIEKSFGKVKASDEVSFSVEKGKLVGLLGPSGSGKTTILRILAGLEDAEKGEIYIAGQQVNQVKASKRGVGFVFQNYALFRYKTVYDNIAFGLKIAKWKKADIKERVEELIDLVGLRGMEKRYPNQLSGGQKQRVAFARALATQPQLLLLDEPFAALDAKVRKELRSWLRELINKVGITSIFVTHDQHEAIEVADEIIVMNQGRIEQIGSPLAVYSKPETEFVAQFLGDAITIEDYGKFKGFSHIGNGGKAILRSEYVTVTKKKELIKYAVSAETGEVLDVAFRGNLLELELLVKGERITAYRQFGQALVEVGEEVNVVIQQLYVIENEQVTPAINEGMRKNNFHVLSNPILESDDSVVI